MTASIVLRGLNIFPGKKYLLEILLILIRISFFLLGVFLFTSNFHKHWSKLFVYSFFGLLITLFVFPFSIINPSFMTIISSDISETTPKSCEIKIIAIPNSLINFSINKMISF